MGDVVSDIERLHGGPGDGVPARVPPTTWQVGDMCYRRAGMFDEPQSWAHYRRDAAEVWRHVGPCVAVDHDGNPPWERQASCTDGGEADR
jgi:hypothetical protein